MELVILESILSLVLVGIFGYIGVECVEDFLNRKHKAV